LVTNPVTQIKKSEFGYMFCNQIDEIGTFETNSLWRSFRFFLFKDVDKDPFDPAFSK